MHVVIAYDISDNAARTRFFKFLREKGMHSQKSVFECEMDQDDINSVFRFAEKLDLEDTDSILIYPLCNRCIHNTIIIGQGIPLVETDWVII